MGKELSKLNKINEILHTHTFDSRGISLKEIDEMRC